MKKIAHSYWFPNNMICTFDHKGEQMPEFQGEASDELIEKIFQNSDGNTVLKGFENNEYRLNNPKS